MARNLQINADLEYQEKAWRVERVAVVVGTLFLLAAALGLFGRGPLSEGEAGTRGGPLQLDYERFTRVGAQSDLTARIGPVGLPGTRIELAISGEYLEDMEVQQVLPDPDSVEVGSERVTYTFAAADAPEVREIKFRMQPREIGLHRAEVAVGDTRLEFSQLAYP